MDKPDVQKPGRQVLPGTSMESTPTNRKINCPSEVKTSWVRTYCNLHALIICINEYDSKEFSLLYGTIHDGHRLKKYFTDKLTVPECQIRMLIGRSASRNNIIMAIKSFQDDERIKTGDPIVIFFAGHGNEISAPASWHSSTQPLVQSIVPQNYCSTPGMEVPCIPDRTLSALLKAIAEKKGNNITVIFDCCHAASGTRGAGDSRARSGPKPIRILTEDLDRDICGGDEGHGTEYPVPEFCHHGLFSHTLIAACGPSELAIESGERGRFSTAFMNLLYAVPPDELRYSQILDRMERVRGQNPQIDGVNLDRFLFNAKPSGDAAPPPIFHPLIYDPMSTRSPPVIPLGTAHGVGVGTKFDVKSNGTPDAAHIGTLTVQESMAFQSYVGFDQDSPVIILPTTPGLSTAVVIQRKAGIRPHQLSLYIARDDNDPNSFHRTLQFLNSLLHNTRYDLHNVVLVDDPQGANYTVSVSKSRNSVAFQLMDPMLGQYIHRIRIPLSDDKIASALEAASDFLWELERTNDEDKSDLMEDISLSAHLLEEKPIPFSQTEVLMEMVPVDGKDLCRNGQLNIVSTRAPNLGFKITNTGNRPVYPVLQYFDFPELGPELGRITTLYEPPMSGPYLLEAPLPAHRSLTIGYGSGGMPPLTLSLQPNLNQDIAIGHLKLSVFTRPLNSTTDKHNHNQNQHIDRPEDTWGACVVPVTLRRHPIATPVVDTPLCFQWPAREKRSVMQTSTHLSASTMTRTISAPAQSSITNVRTGLR